MTRNKKYKQMEIIKREILGKDNSEKEHQKQTTILENQICKRDSSEKESFERGTFRQRKSKKWNCAKQLKGTYMNREKQKLEFVERKRLKNDLGKEESRTVQVSKGKFGNGLKNESGKRQL